jgi:hypothetical protein
LTEAKVVLVEVVTVALVLEPPCVERATTPSRASKACELGLEAKQRITTSLLLVVSAVARLPWSAAVIVECLRRPVRILEHDLGAVVEAARIRHEQVAVAVGVPVRLRNVMLRVEPLLTRRGDVPVRTVPEDEVDLPDLILGEHPMSLDLEEVENGFPV